LLLLALLGICLANELCVIVPSTYLKEGPDHITRDVAPVVGGNRIILLKLKGDWMFIDTVSELKNSSRGWIHTDDIAPCPKAPKAYCNSQSFFLLSSASESSSVNYPNVEINSRFEVISEDGDYYFVAGIVGLSAGYSGFVKKESLSVCTTPLKLNAYNRDTARSYAYQWWNSANHRCGNYQSCTPFSYWGGESCGYPSHGGDCADLVSQSIVAGGHPYLTGGSDYCRGYPCGKEEIGAKKLGDCLSKKFGWKRVCGNKITPPAGVQVGDVIVYHSGSCDAFDAHAVIITKVNSATDVQITCHSSNKKDVSYNYIADSKPYYEFLLFQG